jgi:hypothetical protein
VPGIGFGRVRIRVRQGWLTEQVIMSICRYDQSTQALPSGLGREIDDSDINGQ